MQVAILREAGVFDIVNMDDPKMRPNEVLIEVKACGICGSDLHAYKGLSPDIKFPIILGHEFSGDIIDSGRDVKGARVGDRVCVEPVVTCGDCYFCQKGEYNRCTQIGIIGCQLNGAFAEYISVNEKWLHEIPKNVSYEEGALIEPLAVAVHSVRRCGIKGGEVVVVFGAGTVGNLILQILKNKKASKVIVVDLVDWRLELAKRLGADVTVNSQEKNVVTEVLEITGGIGADVSFEVVGNNEVLGQAIKVTRKGGDIILIGIYEEPIVRHCIMDLIFNELTMKGSAIYCGDFETAIQLVQQGKVNLKPLITRVLPLDNIKIAFEAAIEKVEPVLKIILRP